MRMVWILTQDVTAGDGARQRQLLELVMESVMVILDVFIISLLPAGLGCYHRLALYFLPRLGQLQLDHDWIMVAEIVRKVNGATHDHPLQEMFGAEKVINRGERVHVIVLISVTTIEF